MGIGDYLMLAAFSVGALMYLGRKVREHFQEPQVFYNGSLVNKEIIGWEDGKPQLDFKVYTKGQAGPDGITIVFSDGRLVYYVAERNEAALQYEKARENGTILDAPPLGASIEARWVRWRLVMMDSRRVGRRYG